MLMMPVRLKIKELIMKTIKNVEDLIRMLYPCIIDWAQLYDYSIPSIPWLCKTTLQFNHVKQWSSTYNGKPSTAIGTYERDPGRITVASDREHLQILSTIIHEYAHAVQFFNLGAQFIPEYGNESAKQEHSGNRFENEARKLQSMMAYKRTVNTNFYIATERFEFKFMPKPIAKKTTKKVVKTRPRMGMYEHYYIPIFDGYEHTLAFKVHRNAWWLRR